MMHEIQDVPVKDPKGRRIGKARLSVDDGGNISAVMRLDSELGKELMTALESGFVEAVSFGPVITPVRRHPQALLKPVELPPTENVSFGTEKLESRFGFHKAAIEGPNATAEKHADARINFVSFAKWFDRNTPPGREKNLAMDRLEESSMWFHKAIAKVNPLSKD